MLAQILAAQSDLTLAIAELSRIGNSQLVDEAVSHRQLLARLERTVGNLSPAGLGAIRGEIAGAIAATSMLREQAQAASEQQNIDLDTARARTRASVQEMSRDIYERHVFDPYLRFASAEDEAAYRRREEQNRRAITDALGEHTPEGDLRAARIMRGQLRDAGSHGADASPEFQEMSNRNAADIQRMEAANGRQSASHDEQSASRNTEEPPAPAPATNEQLASVLATFRAAGIGGGIPARDSGHGLTVDGSSPSQGQTIRS